MRHISGKKNCKADSLSRRPSWMNNKSVNADFDKMIECGALVELSDDVMRSWNGPVH